MQTRTKNLDEGGFLSHRKAQISDLSWANLIMLFLFLNSQSSLKHVCQNNKENLVL